MPQILREHRIARGVGEDAQGTGDQHRRHDRQAIQAVGQVHRVGEADDPEIRDDDEAQTPSGIAKFLSSGRYSVVAAGTSAVSNTAIDSAAISPNTDCKAYLCRDFSPFGSRLHDLDPVVEPADQAEGSPARRAGSRHSGCAGRPTAAWPARSSSGSAHRPSSACRLWRNGFAGPSWRIGCPPLSVASLAITGRTQPKRQRQCAVSALRIARTVM